MVFLYHCENGVVPTCRVCPGKCLLPHSEKNQKFRWIYFQQTRKWTRRSQPTRGPSLVVLKSVFNGKRQDTTKWWSAVAFVVGVPQSLHSRKEGKAVEVAGIKRREFQKDSFHGVRRILRIN